MAKIKKKAKVKVHKDVKAKVVKNKHDEALSKFIELRGNVGNKELCKEFGIKANELKKWIKEEEWVEKYYEPIHLSPDTVELLNTAGEDFGLTEQEEAFCYHYIRTMNSHTSALHAGYPARDAQRQGSNLLKSPPIYNFIKTLKNRTAQESLLVASDVIQMYERIAFADMNDFVEISRSGVPRLKPDIDGQLVKSVRKGTDGSVSFELIDKKWALEKLDQLHQAVPNKIAEKTLELQETRVDIEKAKLGDDGSGVKVVDGFEEAFNNTVKKLWGVEDPEDDEEDYVDGESEGEGSEEG